MNDDEFPRMSRGDIDCGTGFAAMGLCARVYMKHCKTHGTRPHILAYEATVSRALGWARMRVWA